ncbi:polyketide synthase [Trichoderma arundinaceum]|uniref:Polyketide synthase n=1 Tax=Trichoderma arundinaceum TaxID=490622 RepID=A0A395NK17_TRIAR|nr:polyketide synthase [Trichoderma arundinaceum]
MKPLEGAPPAIAIVGIGLKLPGGITTTSEYWELLVNKRSTRRQVPENRFGAHAFESKFGTPGTLKSTYGHFLECDLEKWDASFFSMSKAEVEKLDPQHRLLLEVIWECMENGGQKNWRGRNIGCYVGVFGEDWLDLYAKDPQHLGMHRILTGGDFALSNRVSYEYDMKGPSMTIRTACSSSLVALHEACQAIYTGECESAVVAGTSLFLSPTMTIALSEQGVLSPTGSCKTFDAKADGYARGEAINAIFIKKLEDAIRDGDPVRGVIRATATNFDGKTIGITNPNQEAHVNLMRRAYSVAGISNISDTAFVECHGTGTSVGDPMETGAVGQVFGSHGIYIGSVKPNIGHGEGASGLNSLIKAVLSLEHETIPPQINFSEPSPKIRWDKYNFRVPTKPTPWPSDRLQRAIVDSAKLYIPQKQKVFDQNPHLLVFSAHQGDSLKQRAAKILNYAQRHPDCLPDLSYTLGARREDLGQRAFAVYDGANPPELSPIVKPKDSPRVNFVFTGQGAQWAGMGADLLARYPSFRSDIRNMDATLKKLPQAPEWSIEEELIRPMEESRIQQPEFSQPICTALQIGVVNLLRGWDITPAAVVGHSSGEMGAAYAAGALTLEAAIIIAYYRGQVTQNHGRVGAMAAVGLGREDASLYLQDGVVIACENSPKSVTLSGDVECLDEVIASIKKDLPDCFARKLRVERAYHSHHMCEIGDRYEKLLQGLIKDQKPQIPIFSSVTRRQIKRAGQLGPSYWRQNLENPVLFSPAIQLMMHSAIRDTVYLEIGPHAALSGPLRDIFKSIQIPSASIYIPTLIRNESGPKSMLSALGRLYQEAVPVNIAATTPGRTVLTDLPNYAWQHDTAYWYESRVSRDWRLRKFPPHELLGNRILESDDLEPSWRNMFRLDDVPWARDHKIQDDIVFPAAAFIAMVIEAVRQLGDGGETDASLRQVEIHSALVLKEQQAHEIVTHLRPVRLTSKLNSIWYEFSVSSFNGTSWTKHCTGKIRTGKDISAGSEDVGEQPRQVSTAGWYRIMKKVGLNYGPEFQGLSDISAYPGRNTAAATIKNRDLTLGPYYPLHPSVIDLVLQAFTVAIADGLTRQLKQLCVPTYIEELYINISHPEMRLGTAAVSSLTGAIRGSATIMANDKLVLSLRNGEFSPLESGDSYEYGPMPSAHLHWRPHVDFIAPNNLIQSVRPPPGEVAKIEKLALLYQLDILRRIESLSSPTHLVHFRKWLTKQRTKALNNKYEHVSDCSRLARLNLKKARAEIETTKKLLSHSSCASIANIFDRLATNAESILRGEQNANDIFKQDGSFGSLHKFISDRSNFSLLFGSLAHANPTMKVLELSGGGAPNISAGILKAMVNTAGTRSYGKYIYTTCDEESLEFAQQMLKGHENVEYRILDISQDSKSQDFEPASFDLIIANRTLHSSYKIQDVLQNLRGLIKPSGRLLIQEVSPSANFYSFIMGFSPDWWSDMGDGRVEERLFEAHQWDSLLVEAGFSGCEGMMMDEDNITANILTTAPTAPRDLGKVTILGHPKSQEYINDISGLFSAQGYEVKFSTLAQEPDPDADVISLLDLHDTMFFEMTEDTFDSWQNYINKFPAERGLLWVTGHAQVGSKDPRYATSIGTTRNIRSELSLDFATLEMDLTDFDPEDVLNVFEKFYNRIKDDEFDPDWEYAIVNGRVMIPRYQWIDIAEHAGETACIKSDVPKQLEIFRMGQLQTLQWTEDKTVSLGDNQVEIEPRAVGMNFKDILVAMGIVEGYKPGLGIECSGIIRKAGRGVNGLSPGDRVMTIGHGCFATTFISDADLVVKIPDNLSFEEAATVPCVYATAIHSLINLGGLCEGMSVLVHSACGGVGIAALNICKMMGAKIYATVGNGEKIQYLIDNFGIPREHIFNSRDSSFYGDLMAVTGGQGADLVLNSLSGELLHTSWKCVAQFGKMLEIGKRDFIGRGQLGMEIFESNRSFHGIDMSQMAVERPDRCKKILQQFNEYYEKGAIKPIAPVRLFEATDIIEAFRYMQKGQHIGKIVVSMPADTSKLQVAAKSQAAKFKSDRTYLLVGGLGGLGRSVSNWMVQNGTRHIMYLSRSAGDSEQDRKFIKEIEAQGCAVQAIKGSVTSLQDVYRAVNQAAKPIAGVFLMTMVLRDRGILHLSHDDWFTAAGPKVDGAINLHQALEHCDLDFFTLFSSISYVVGQVGQANYSAANAYLTAFTQFRHEQGLPAGVLNVGVVDDVGYVVENQALLEQFRALSFYTLGETELLEALTYTLSHQHPATSFSDDGFFNPAELVIGLKSTKSLSDPNNRCIWKRDRRMAQAHLHDADEACGSSAGSEDFGQFMKSVNANHSLLDTPSNLEFLTAQIGMCIYNLMSRDVKELDLSLNLTQLGVDSLVAIEIRNWWRRTIGVNVSVLEFMGAGSIANLGKLAAKAIKESHRAA